VQCQRAGEAGSRGLGSPGLGRRPVLVLDDYRSIVVPHARLGQGESRRAEGAFGGHAADQPLGAAAAGAVVHLMLAVDNMVTASGRVVPHLEVTKGRD